MPNPDKPVLLLQPDRHSPDPRWRQIAEHLSERISAGQLGSDGEALPTEAELASEYGAARNTIRHAMGWLAQRGLIMTGSGRRSYVTPAVDPLVTMLDRDRSAGPRAAQLSSASARAARHEVAWDPRPLVRVRRAAGAAAAQLELAADALVVSRHQDGLVDGSPYSRQTTFYPHSFVTRGAEKLLFDEDMDDGVVSYLGDVLGIREDGWLDIFDVRVPRRTEADFFELPDDGRIPVIEWIRTGYDQFRQPLRVTITTCAAGRNVFAIPTGNVPDKSPALGWLRDLRTSER